MVIPSSRNSRVSHCIWLWITQSQPQPGLLHHVMKWWKIKPISVYGNINIPLTHVERSSVLLALCEGNPMVTSGFPLQRATNLELWCLPKQAIEQTVELLLIWCSCNVTVMTFICRLGCISYGVLQRYSHYTPRTTKLLGVYWFHSVRLSVRPSVRLSRLPCPLCNI